MATWYDVGFVFPRDKISPEMLETLQKTFKSFDYDFPIFSEETVWRGPQCYVKDVLDFCTLVTGVVFKGYQRHQSDYGFHYGCPPDDKLEVGEPTMPVHVGRELVWNFIPNMPDYCNPEEFSLCQKLVRLAYGDETTALFLIFTQPFDDKFYYLDKEEIHRLFHGILYP